MNRKFNCDIVQLELFAATLFNNILKGSKGDEEAIDLGVVPFYLHLYGEIMIWKVNKCFLSALCNATQWKICGFRQRKKWRTLTLGNSVGMPMFLYYHHTVNRDCLWIGRMPTGHACFIITRTDEMKLSRMSVEKWWNEICDRGRWEKPRVKPTPTQFRPPWSPHGVRDADLGLERW